MLTICFCSTKGGGGKSSLAAHLAVEAERNGDGPVAIIDADPQASLSRWWNSRKSDTPAFIQASIKSLPEQLQALKDSGYRLVVIDTPGADVSHIRLILR